MLRPLSILILIALAGCKFSGSQLDTTASEPLELSWSETWRYAPYYVAFTPDGQYFLAAGRYGVIKIFQTQGHKILERLDAGNTTRAVYGAGFIESDKYYYAQPLKEGGIDVFVKPLNSIEAPQVRHFENEQASLVVAGKHFAAHNTELIDWLSGERSKVRTVHPTAPRYQLTRSGRVLTSNQGYLLLHDPRRDESLLWDSRLSVSQAKLTDDEAYLVANDADGACRVWRVPDTQTMSSCGSGSLLSHGRALLELAGQSFATTWNNRVALYALAPYERRFVREMPKDIVALALTENGLLALADETGRIELWDTGQNRLLGHYQPRGSQGQALDHVEKLALDASGKLLVSAINLQGRQEARLLLLEPATAWQP